MEQKFVAFLAEMKVYRIGHLAEASDARVGVVVFGATHFVGAAGINFIKLSRLKSGYNFVQKGAPGAGEGVWAANPGTCDFRSFSHHCSAEPQPPQGPS
jgi:hypothetical protein